MLRYARMLVDMRIEGSFPKFIEFFNKHEVLIRQQVKYEWIPTNCLHCGCLAMLKNHGERNLESGKNGGKSSISNLKSKKLRRQMSPPRAQFPPPPQLGNSYQALVNEGSGHEPPDSGITPPPPWIIWSHGTFDALTGLISRTKIYHQSPHRQFYPSDRATGDHGPTGDTMPKFHRGGETSPFSMPNTKSPNPDGYSSGLFKATWDMTMDMVCSAILDFFKTGHMRLSKHRLLILLDSFMLDLPSSPSTCDFILAMDGSQSDGIDGSKCGKAARKEKKLIGEASKIEEGSTTGKILFFRHKTCF
ncbi:hypothetical protein Cgig2_020711 [Carnegiea gigantea]|uniref:Uncharacterized protein n=1 Tax=Carnegiea gigantea TaxID=171969 RepID=A0A9Q1JGY4_9CARY|nr:hypothetical protein Cgig2_020711 [Carnegiea gigantea]